MFQVTGDILKVRPKTVEFSYLSFETGLKLRIGQMANFLQNTFDMICMSRFRRRYVSIMLARIFSTLEFAAC